MLYIGVYRALRVSGLGDLQFQGSRIMIHFRRYRPVIYQMLPKARYWENWQGVKVVPMRRNVEWRVNERRLPKGDYLTAAVRFDPTPGSDAIRQGRVEMEPILGALSVLGGNRVAYVRVGDALQDENPEKHLYETFSEGVLYEEFVAPARYRKTDRQAIDQALLQLDDTSNPDLDSVNLALRWYWKSLEEARDVDKLIDLCVALEAYPAKGARNPENRVKEYLTRATRESPDFVSRTYLLQQAFALRGQVLHRGLDSLSERQRKIVVALRNACEAVLSFALTGSVRSSLGASKRPAPKFDIGPYFRVTVAPDRPR